MEKKELNILMITSRSDMGGGPKHLYLLVERLKLVPELNIFIASPDTNPFYKKYMTQAKAHLKIPHRSFSLISFFMLIFFCKSQDIKIIHSHGRGAGLYSRLLKLWGLKVIHTFHGAHNDPSLLGQLKLLIDKYLNLNTDQFICVSESEKNKVLDLNLAKERDIVVINNGISFKEVSEESPLIKLPEKKQNKAWGTLTRLSPEKGNDLLLELLKKSPPPKDITFYIAGNGPQRNRYESFVQRHKISNVHFLGEIDSPISFLKSLDGFFSFSHGEGLPLSVLEALACGLPCVLSDVSGHDQFKSLVQLFDLENPSKFYSLIQMPVKAINLPELEKKFSDINMASKTHDIYKKLAAQ